MRFLLDIAPVDPAVEFMEKFEEILLWMGLGIGAMVVVAIIWIAYLMKKNKK